MLPKRQRLTTPEVAQVLKFGRSRRATYLSVKFLATDTPLAVSVVVSKSVARKATRRNQLRRAVYRALQSPTLAPILVLGKGQAVLFVQKIPPQDLTQTFLQEVAVLFKNAML